MSDICYFVSFSSLLMGGNSYDLAWFWHSFLPLRAYSRILCVDHLPTPTQSKNGVAINSTEKSIFLFTLKLCYNYFLNERNKDNIESRRDFYHGNNTSQYNYVLMIYR